MSRVLIVSVFCCWAQAPKAAIAKRELEGVMKKQRRRRRSSEIEQQKVFTLFRFSTFFSFLSSSTSPTQLPRSNASRALSALSAPRGRGLCAWCCIPRCGAASRCVPCHRCCCHCSAFAGDGIVAVGVINFSSRSRPPLPPLLSRRGRVFRHNGRARCRRLAG